MASAHNNSADSSDLVYQISKLSRSAGSMCKEQLSVPAPGDLSVDMIGVPKDSNIVMDLVFESVVGGVWVHGNADVTLEGECARCLAEFSYGEIFDLEQIYYWPNKEAEEGALFVVDDTIDLDPILRDAVVLNLPFAPLCSDDCLGLCAQCGFELNNDPSHNHGEQIDSRWQQLTKLLDPGENQ